MAKLTINVDDERRLIGAIDIVSGPSIDEIVRAISSREELTFVTPTKSFKIPIDSIGVFSDDIYEIKYESCIGKLMDRDFITINFFYRKTGEGLITKVLNIAPFVLSDGAVVFRSSVSENGKFIKLIKISGDGFVPNKKDSPIRGGMIITKGIDIFYIGPFSSEEDRGRVKSDLEKINKSKSEGKIFTRLEVEDVSEVPEKSNLCHTRIVGRIYHYLLKGGAIDHYTTEINNVQEMD